MVRLLSWAPFVVPFAFSHFLIVKEIPQGGGGGSEGELVRYCPLTEFGHWKLENTKLLHSGIHPKIILIPAFNSFFQLNKFREYFILEIQSICET
jgi:hypothetical protein